MLQAHDNGRVHLQRAHAINFGRALDFSHAPKEGVLNTRITLILPVKSIESEWGTPKWSYLYWALSQSDLATLKDLLQVPMEARHRSFIMSCFDVRCPEGFAVDAEFFGDRDGGVFFRSSVKAAKSDSSVRVVNNCYLSLEGLGEMIRSAQARPERIIGVAPEASDSVYLFSETVILKTDDIHRFVYDCIKDFNPVLEQKLDMLCLSLVRSP